MDERSGKLLIVDDNADFNLALRMLLSPYFNEIVTETNPEKVINRIDNQAFDLILLDMNFRAGMHSGNEGFYWMEKIHRKDPCVRIIFITGYGDIALAVESMKKGAADFIEKSWEERKILSTILVNYRLGRSMNEANRRKEQQSAISESISSSQDICFGVSSRMKAIWGAIEKVAPTEANILITGESGTGKEIAARQIHKLSKRSGEVFMSVDLGSIPATLFESELFGYAKGAFTDASRDKPGKIEMATGGTLFLDEIGNLPIQLQVKMLGALQQKMVHRLGETRPRMIDFRLISATNASIDDMITQKSFREDLYYRLRTVEINLPPLRERPEDIPELASSFIDQFRKKYNKSGLRVDPAVFKKLSRHYWPGNIRELQHQVEKAVILNDSGTLAESDFIFSRVTDMRKRAETLNLEENEKQLILKAIKKFDGNLTKAASELGINRSTLYEKIKKYEIRQI